MTGENLRILGVMTGTSCDALDAACVEFSGERWKVLWTASRPYPAPLRKRVGAAQLPKTRASSLEFLELHRDLGLWYGDAIHGLIERHQPQPHLIANHGQTIAHFPAPKRQGMTWQMGDPARIAWRTGLSVLTEFRAGDLAAGGEGAPLAPLFHGALAQLLPQAWKDSGVSFHNLGGISNLTYVDPRGEILAWDTGPASFWIDESVVKISKGAQRFDTGGKLAARGKADFKVVSKILALPYFSKSPPKSTGRDDFPFSLFMRHAARLRGADLVATATEITLRSIQQDYEKWILGKNRPLGQILVCGGGAKNRTLLQQLNQRLVPVEVRALTDWNPLYNSQYIEALAFAYMGYQALRGRPIAGPWTKKRPLAKEDPGFATPAHILPGKNWAQVLRMISALN